MKARCSRRPSEKWLRPLARGGTPSLRDFYLKRAFRILPAFWAVLALYLLWPGFREAPGMEPWWKFALFVVNLDIDYAANAAFSHAWSLCVEEHFYLLFPALAMLLARRPSAMKFWAVCVAVLLGGVALRSGIWLHDDASQPQRPWFVVHVAVEHGERLRTWRERQRARQELVGDGAQPVHVGRR